MGQTVSFAGVQLDLESDWCDITDTLPVGTTPTLALEGGIGALQFSIAQYSRGKPTNIERVHLEQLLYYFEDAQDLGRVHEVIQFHGDGTFGISCDYDQPSEFIRVWYVTDGMSIAFVTYTSTNDQSEAFQSELGQATAIAESVQFHPRNSESV
ncbi:MAG TPA: hypothetical protein DDZ88_19325 [Verrucomicrobiales bacterium]|nr:hypothetical protein [Verrucomicrobiales bacterium]